MSNVKINLVSSLLVSLAKALNGMPLPVSGYWLDRVQVVA